MSFTHPGFVCVGLIAVALAAMVASDPSPPASGRTLGEHELWRRFGGGQVADACCVVLTNCNGTGQACSDKNGQPMMCMLPYEQVDLFSGNKEVCRQDAYMGKTCTYNDDEHLCKQRRWCVWDPSTSQCLINSGGGTTTVSAPDDCSDDCGP